MAGIIAKMLLGKILSSDDVKGKIIDALRAEAKKTDNKIDDDAVDVFEAVWGVVVPIILGGK